MSPGREEEQRERLAQLLGRGEDITREDLDEIEDELTPGQQKWIDFQTALLVAPDQCVRSAVSRAFASICNNNSNSTNNSNDVRDAAGTRGGTLAL